MSAFLVATGISKTSPPQGSRKGSGRQRGSRDKEIATLRSHAKASTAGSNQRQAKGLGRIFRGADAGRGASPDPKGSGASSGRRGPLLVLATALASAALCLAPGLASAAPVGFEFLGAFGPDGTSLTEFEAAGSVAVDHEEEAVYVLDRAADALFKFDFEGNPVNFGGFSPDINGNELSGLQIGGGLGQRQVAVDSASNTIYLTGGEEGGEAKALQAFQSNGEPSLFTDGPGEGTNEIGGFAALRGVTVDSSGNIYVSGVDSSSQNSNNIEVYAPSGALLLDGISASAPYNMAVDSNGILYVLRNIGQLVRYTPSEFPVTPATTYTVSPDRVDPHEVLSMAVDPLTDRVYAVEFIQEEGSPAFQVAVFNEEGALEGTFGGPGEGGELHFADGIAVANVEEAGIEGDVARPFVAHNPVGGLAQVEMFQEELVIAAPSVELTSATAVTGDSATLRARINPNNRATTYWFEYGLGDCEISTCAKVPLGGAPIGAGRKGVAVSRFVSGLQAQTVYHYRVVAENEIETSEGPDRTFATQGSGLGFALSDSRAWEMVSPPRKFGGTLINAGGTIIQASASGGGLAYASRGSLVEEPLGNRLPEPTTMLAKRSAGGSWASEDLTPQHSEASRITPDTPFKIFAPDLRRAALEATDDTPLSPEASERTPYLWSGGEPPLFTPLVNPSNVPPGTKFGPREVSVGNPVRIEGATPGLDHVIIRSDEASLVDGAVPRSIYLWSNGQLEAVSELPESEGGAIGEGILGSGEGSVRHAVSDDGSRVFWSIGTYIEANIELTALYLRDTVAGKSTRLDVVQSGPGGGEAVPVFSLASADGSVVFFTDSQRLTEDASPSGRDLYRCEIGTVAGGLGCAELTDISAPIAGSGKSAEVMDQVPGASEDGTRLYFVARGVLDEAPNEEGDTATAGEPNLYLWQEGEGVRFIARLSGQDHPVWGTAARSHGYAGRITAAASPSGRFFAFTSERSLTGYENRNVGDELNTEVFLYDAEASEDRLTCVSCNPTGAAAVGELIPADVKFLPQDPTRLWVNRWVSAALPEASQTEGTSFGQGPGRSLYRPRSVLDNGRVFFNAVDPLVPADSNGNWDVYQHEPVGVGSCAADTSSAAMTRSANGCVGLLSSGTAEGDAGFLDASPSGNDVFFLTRGKLSVLDYDEELDAYDARVDGIPATLEPDTECLGEACQPAALAPNDPTPASAGFRGQGNLKAAQRKRCAKGKRRAHRAGKVRCVPRKRRAGQERRAAR
jgi:hypothetical protein